MSDTSLSERSLELQDNDLFGSLIWDCQHRQSIPVAVCWPCSSVSLAGAVEAAVTGLIYPLLVGRKHDLLTIAHTLDLNLDKYPILDVNTEEEAATQSVELCRSGQAVALMKGSLHTDLLMHAVLKESDLRTCRRVSHIFLMEAPLYHRRVLLSQTPQSIFIPRSKTK